MDNYLTRLIILLAVALAIVVLDRQRQPHYQAN
jgi:hypothetical protein